MRGKKIKMREMRSRLIFGACTVISGAAALFGMNVLSVMAEENVGEEVVVSNNAPDTGENELSENALNTGGDENLGVYDFKDNKTTGTVTVTKVWDDDKTNEERAIPDIKISTAKPGKNPLGYTVTFHGNKDAGLVVDDGSDVNEVVYNSSGQIVEGVFKIPKGWGANAVAWFTDEALTNKVDVSEDGTVPMALSGDVDLYGKVKTFEIKGYNGNYSESYNDFNYLIPDTVTEIFFTDEIKPERASIIDVDADGDGMVVAWTENDGTVMKVSTQIKGMKVQAPKDSGYMFYNRNNVKTIDLTNLDTVSVTSMSGLFQDCSGLTTLDLSSLDTQNVTDMGSMFNDCSGLTALDLSSFDTQNVAGMGYMFRGCSGLTALDLSSFDTQKVMDMDSMFYLCGNLASLTTGQNFKFVGTNYRLDGTWQNTADETFNGNSGTANFPSNIADTYTKISD